MKKTVLLLAIISSAGHAADNTWSGCYAGASASHLQSDNQWTTTFISGEELNQNAGSASADETDIGVQFGCDFFESEKSVWGVKVMASNANLLARHTYIEGASPANTISYETEDVLSIVGRYGFKVSDDGLLYGQLGYVKSDHDYEDNDPSANPFFAFGGSLDRNGLLWGIGYEHKFFEQVSFFVEYSFTDFGTEKNVSMADRSTVNISDYLANINQDLSQFNLGVNYRF